MNQILVTEKLYVTPSLKRKRKFYKFDFFLSVFLVCILFSYYIYAEYDRNRSEEVSKDILQSINVSFDQVNKDDENAKESKIVKVLLDYSNSGNQNMQLSNTGDEIEEITDIRSPVYEENGVEYRTIGVITIPKLNIEYPILDKPTDEQMEEMLKISICKFHGPNANEVGNLCLVGHNYHNSKFFSKLSTLENGDIVEVKGLNGKTLKYKVYDQYVVEPTDVACTSQLTHGKTEITLITCYNNGKQRTVIKAVAE